ncbi:F-box associated domain type 3 [Arabidopsis suecica]|uniref:F-box associated domain type 3 n=1 Tax=Arabidopsis suecica TaxID=45249 RepID=A0A8T2AMU7_ARASU|nr:F-box associated domain type 3 [Arabidopsis suecica]
MKFLFNFSFERFSPINGLLCLRHECILKGRKKPVWGSVICNPSTGQSLPLPRMKTRRSFGGKSFFGYDPIQKLFKVLSMTLPYGIYNGNCEEYQVLTLGTGKLSWRLIECCRPHFPVYNEVCINGVLYYLACVNGFLEVVVYFDFGSEKFRFMKVMENFSGAVRPGNVNTTLINYNGKLGLLMSGGLGCDNRISGSIELWVLEDPEKHEWSKHIYVLPPLWRNVVGEAELDFVGMIGTNEIVLSQRCLYERSYIFYYNITRNTIVKVEIQGMELFERSRLHTFLNHVENVKLMQEF